MLCFFPRLGVLREVKKVLGFPQMFSFDPGSSIQLLSNNTEKIFPLNMVEFYPGRSHHLKRIN